MQQLHPDNYSSQENLKRQQQNFASSKKVNKKTASSSVLGSSSHPHQKPLIQTSTSPMRMQTQPANFTPSQQQLKVQQLEESQRKAHAIQQQLEETYRSIHSGKNLTVNLPQSRTPER